MHDYMYCGLDCIECEYKDKCSCKGCRNSKGNPFYGKCRLAKCVLSHNIQYCFECSEFPCDLLNEFAFDPVHGNNGKRIRTLEELKNRQ